MSPLGLKRAAASRDARGEGKTARGNAKRVRLARGEKAAGLERAIRVVCHALEARGTRSNINKATSRT